jgi:tetratricopeptide (TPR) repeat protein
LGGKQRKIAMTSRTILGLVKAGVVMVALCVLQTAWSPGALSAMPAPAVGEGSASGAAAIPCERSFVYSKTRQGCVRANAGLLDDKELYEQGRALALAGHYGNALDALRAMRDQSNAPALTMIGYAERKLGNTAEALKAYEKALALDPDNADAHEYLGEAYVAMGRIDLAGHELETLARICGKACEQYGDLAAAIAGTPDRSP